MRDEPHGDYEDPDLGGAYCAGTPGETTVSIFANANGIGMLRCLAIEGCIL